MIATYSLIIAIGVILTIIPINLHPIFLKLRKPPQIPSHKKQLYEQHIKSAKWRKIKQRRLAKDGYMCKNWHWWPVKSNLEVHHKSYRNLGNEKQWELITLCKRCHNKIHKRKS